MSGYMCPCGRSSSCLCEIQIPVTAASGAEDCARASSGMRPDGQPCPCCGDWPVTLPPGPCSCQPAASGAEEGQPAAAVRKPIAPPSAPHTPPRPDNYRPYA